MPYSEQLSWPGRLAFSAACALSVSIFSQHCCNFSSPAAHVGEHRTGTSGPSGGSPVRGIESFDGVGKRPLHALMTSTNTSNSGSRIFVFLLSLSSRDLALCGPLVFTLTHCCVVSRLGLLPLLDHLGAAMLEPATIQPESSERGNCQRE